MYIPASSLTQSPRSNTPLSGRCSPSTTVTGTLKHPSLSLRLQSPGRRSQQIKKTAGSAPAIVRNNSGEIVRPCLRNQASGGSVCQPAMRTPRFVHFGTDLECVRWFLKAQSPRSVCEDAMPEWGTPDDVARVSQAEAERTSTVRLTGIRRPAPSYAVYEPLEVVLERVELANTQRSAATLRGTVKVHNMAFEKSVVVRYSFDQWKSAHEATAVFSRTLLEPQAGRPGVDRFVFTLALPATVTATLPATVALCARYTVAGAEYWDNNKGANYLFRLALPAAPAIADDECGDRDAVATRSLTTELSAPRRLTFGGEREAAPVPASSAADTRRYMAQSAAVFGRSGGSNMAMQDECLSPSGYMHSACTVQRELPLFQDVAWCGDFASAPSMSGSAFGTGITLPAARSSASAPLAPMRTGSPIRLAVFDTEGSVRAGSPLAWSRHNSASALLC
ncbi:hypothetical protein H4218_003759 [Coemansia sp. IMI 209128]|nr:hypothetical protein GGI10_001523 [Coemansia sp. RSA 2530]KAJ2697729.1 hypothetical protein H4218_003759 [Coemansia sp. IMI 209128]